MTILHALITPKGDVSLNLTTADRRKVGVVLKKGDGVLCGREPDVARAQADHALPATVHWKTLSIDGDREVSRNHVALWLEGGRLQAKDLSSLGTSFGLPRGEDEDSTIRIPIEIPVGAPGEEVSFDLHVGSGAGAVTVSPAGGVEALTPVAWRDQDDFNDQVRIKLQAWLDRRKQGGTVEIVPAGQTSASGAKSSIAEGRRIFQVLGEEKYLLVRFGGVPLKDLPDLFRAVDDWVDEQKERYAREASCQCQGKFALVSDAIRRCHEQIVRAAKRERPTNVLVRGPTGSGKTVCAHCFRHNHRDEFRQDADRFRAINCGAIAPGLMESELFGHVKGAFPNALTNRAGVIRSAHRGIVFLDEVGELSLAAQVALLKVIEEKKVRPVGADREVDVDVVFISASNLDFEKAIREGRFREDLYFRLAQAVVNMPPLADRLEDVAGIISLEGDGPRLLSRLDDDARAFLLGEGKGATYPWRGNAREVKEFVANMDDHIAREGPITLAQCRAVLMPTEGSSAAPQSPPSSQPPAAASAPFNWLEIYDRAVARSLADAKNKVDNYALWSKAVLIGQLVATRKGASSPSEMPDPKKARDDKETRALFIKLAGELEVGAWTTVADHYEAFFALLEGKPHPRRDKSVEGNRDPRIA